MEGSSDRLIGALLAGLRPLRPLLSPALRTLIWLMLVAVVAVALAMSGRGGGVASLDCRSRYVACGAWLDCDHDGGGVRRV